MYKEVLTTAKGYIGKGKRIHLFIKNEPFGSWAFCTGRRYSNEDITLAGSEEITCKSCQRLVKGKGA